MGAPKKKSKKKKKMTHTKKKKGAEPQPHGPLFDPTQRWHLDLDPDAALRKLCEGVVLI